MPGLRGGAKGGQHGGDTPRAEAVCAESCREPQQGEWAMPSAQAVAWLCTHSPPALLMSSPGASAHSPALGSGLRLAHLGRFGALETGQATTSVGIPI